MSLSIFILVSTGDSICSDSIGKPVVGDHHPFLPHVSAISVGTGQSIRLCLFHQFVLYYFFCYCCHTHSLQKISSSFSRHTASVLVPLPCRLSSFEPVDRTGMNIMSWRTSLCHSFLISCDWYYCVYTAF